MIERIAKESCERALEIESMITDELTGGKDGAVEGPK